MPKLPPDQLCLFVHGSTACSEDWLADARAQLPDDSTLILAGASAQAAPALDALRLPSLDESDPRRLLDALVEPFRGSHVMLLRSDAELPPFAFARLLRALNAPDVLAASVLDNLDPERAPVNSDAVTGEPSARIDALCHAYSRRQLIDVRDVSVLASVWHSARPQRTDRAQPASAAAPSRVVMLDHLYVAAAGRALSGPESARADCDRSPPSPLAELREQVVAALASTFTPGYAGLDGKPTLLHVLHGWGGGAERWVRDFCSAYGGAHHRVLIARGSHQRKRHGEWLELHDGAMTGPALLHVALPVAIADTSIGDTSYRILLDEIIETHAIAGVIVSSLIGHSLDVLRTGLPTVRIVHDHYPLWPVLHRDFGDRALPFDDAQRVTDLAALGDDREFANRDAFHWKALRDAFATALIEANAMLIAPSRSALDADLALAPELAVLDQHVIAHGLAPWPGDAPRREPAPLHERLRLVVPGRVRRGKGAELLTNLLPQLQEFADVFLLGAGSDAHAFFGRRGVHIVLDYRRDELPRLLATIAPDAALLLPTVSETFGYTLSELRALGIPVIATRLGALAERIADGVDGFLVPPDATQIAARVSMLAHERSALTRVRTTLATHHEPDLADMANAYSNVLGMLHPVKPATLHAISLDSQQLADRATALQATKRRARQLDLERSAALAESARRGEWGHALDRELIRARSSLGTLQDDLAARTEWALQLDRELNILRPAHANMLASRSWRLTSPMRAGASRLRDLRARFAFRKAHIGSILRRLRGSVARNGWGGTLARVLHEVRGRPAQRAPQFFAAPDESFSPFAVPTSAAPVVSIIIPVHNKFAYTAACLRSLTEHAATTPFEVIVVDDCSTDVTVERLAKVGGIRSVRNVENLGFVGSCNAGAAVACGEFVLFLNNDTVVTAGWLEALLRCFAEQPDAGLVGAQLVYPDGRLQEAGGIIFNDGSGWNYGRFDDPDDPRYAYRRESDYCSGAAILLRRALFEQLGRFDLRYAPAYYEDADLAFSVRAAGLKVYYEPRARVIHFEGISAGTDTAGSGMKRFQIINHAKFVDKWKHVLPRQPVPGTTIGLAATHRAQRRILIIDAVTPSPDRDAGSLRMVNLMRVLIANACHVVFMASNRAWSERYTAELQALGIEVLYHPLTPEPVALLRARGQEFDAIVLSRHYVAAEYVGLVRLYAPRARLIFDTVDLHYLREQRAAELEGRADLARQAAATKRHELKLMRECDITLVVSPFEQALLAVDAPNAAVDVLSTVHEVHGSRTSFTARRDVVFVGSFQHPPNVDAVLWYVREIQPLVLARLPNIVLHIVGSGVTAEVQALACDNVIVHGFVEDIAPLMDTCRISIAPLRYGAGVKGKINTAMSYGLPVVATTIAVEGMHFRLGEDVLAADDAATFAAAIVALYADEEMWNRLSRNGLANVREHFSFDAAQTAIRRIVGF